MVMDLEDEGREYSLHNFQSIASICLTTDWVPLLTGVTTYPPPAKHYTINIAYNVVQKVHYYYVQYIPNLTKHNVLI
jgi:hypothetical protein